MTSGSQPRPILLVGSIPLASAEDVFKAVAAELGPLVARISDGETGDRSMWIVCQGEPIKKSSGLEVGGERVLQGGIRNPRYKIKQGLTPDDVRFARLGYADNALSSYGVFKGLKSAGQISASEKFQVCVPTPLSVVYAFFIAEEVRRVWPVYEKALLAEIDEILAKIPHAELAIQLDIATEVHSFIEDEALKGLYPFEELLESFSRFCNRIPADVELGVHLCYGDPGHKHVREPVDMARMVEIHNRLALKLHRPMTWIHMPVPRDRDDDAYFAPLRQILLHDDTELYLGLIHLTDGIEGARRRAAAAKRVVSDFGVATECGFGRRPPQTIPDLLRLHGRVAREI
jgi:hypothetical protein